MSTLPSQRLAQCLLVPLLMVILASCVGSRAEPFAPELKKNYVLTEDLVQTSQEIQPPGLFQPRRSVAFVMTREEFLFSKKLIESNYPPDTAASLLPELGEVTRGSRVGVEQVFTYSDFKGNTRYGKFQFMNPATGAQHTAYGRWQYIGPKLREVK